VQFGRAFHCRVRFQSYFQCQKLKNDVQNAVDSLTHIQTAHTKRKCNRPLKMPFTRLPPCILVVGHTIRAQRCLTLFTEWVAACPTWQEAVPSIYIVSDMH
jgi:hypothetical protein